VILEHQGTQKEEGKTVFKYIEEGKVRLERALENFSFSLVLGIIPKASCMLNKCSTTELYPQLETSHKYFGQGTLPSKDSSQ
jgi:hypothetical protein